MHCTIEQGISFSSGRIHYPGLPAPNMNRLEIRLQIHCPSVDLRLLLLEKLTLVAALFLGLENPGQFGYSLILDTRLALSDLTFNL